MYSTIPRITGEMTMLFFSCDGTCQKPSGWEKDISVALNAASTLLVRSEAKVRYICDGN